MKLHFSVTNGVGQLHRNVATNLAEAIRIVDRDLDDDMPRSMDIALWELTDKAESKKLLAHRKDGNWNVYPARGPCGFLYHAHDCICNGEGGDR